MPSLHPTSPSPLTSPSQVAPVQQLVAAARQYTRVKVYCTQADWTSRVLAHLTTHVRSAEVARELVSLCEELCAFSITARQVRLLLWLMKGRAPKCRSLWWPVLLAVLHRATQAAPGPAVYFDFAGVQSGISLPPFARLPSGGVSVALWLRCESFAHPQQHEGPAGVPYEPCVYTLTDEHGVGLALKFSSNVLVVDSVAAPGKPPTRVRSVFPFRTHQWYCVAVTHEYHFLGSDECRLFVDGIERGKFSLPYPKAVALTRAYFGCAAPARARPAHLSALIGQMGPMVLVEDPLSAPACRGLFELPLEAWNDVAALQRVASKVIAAYNPRAIDGALCLETSHGKRNHHATKLEGTTEIRQCDVGEAVLCCGGPHVLLPLLSQLHLPPEPPSDPSLAPLLALMEEERANVPPSHHAAAILDVLAVCSRHRLAERDLVAHHGMQLLGHVLRFVPSLSVWDDRSFASLELLCASTAHSERLHRAFFINVYLNFRVWVFAPVSVQKHVLVAVARHASRNPPYFRAMITVQRLVDALHQFYWTTASEWALGKADVVDAVTGAVIGSRPKEGRDMLTVRDALLHVVRALVVGPPTPAEVDALVLHLLMCPDVAGAGGECVDVLRLLLVVLNDGEHAVATARHLLRAHGLGSFVALAGRQSEALVVWSIKAFAKCLQLWRPEAGDTAAPGATREATLSLTSWLCVLKAYLYRRGALSSELYGVLLELLLESVDTASLCSPVVPGTEQLMCNPLVALTVLELLCVARDSCAPELAVRCLKDLLHFLDTRANRLALLHVDGWDTRLVALIVSSAHGCEQESLAVDVLSLLMQHCLMEGDWARVGRVHATMALLGSGAAERVTALLCARVAEQLALASSEVLEACRHSEPALNTLCRWLAFAEMALCYERGGGGSAVFALATLCEVLVAVVAAHNKHDDREHQMCSQLVRVSIASMHVAVSEGLAQRRLSSDVCLLALGGVVRRFQTFVPRWVSWVETAALDALLAAALDMREALDCVASLVQWRAAADEPIRASLAFVGGALRALRGASDADVALLADPSVVASGALYELALTARASQGDKFQALASKLVAQLAARADEVRERASAQGLREATLVSAALGDWEVRWGERKAREEERRNALFRATARKNSLLANEWNKLLWSLASERGPWAPPSASLTPELAAAAAADAGSRVQRWMVDRSESSDASWIRCLKRPNKAFRSHAGCARGALPPGDDTAESQASARASMPALAAFMLADDVPSDGEASDVDDQQQQQQQQSPQQQQPQQALREDDFSVSFDCLMAVAHARSQGVLELSAHELSFCAGTSVKRWALAQLEDVRDLRWGSRRVALEMRFVGGRTRLFAFAQRDDALRAYQYVLSLRPPRLRPVHFAGLMQRKWPPSCVGQLKAAKDTEQWLAGRLSNFDYLMAVNRAAGRSYCDLAQWPVFPWVVADWHSDALDLDNPASFRDLSLPVGALNPARRDALRSRYAELRRSAASTSGGDAHGVAAAPFHHGSHYCTPASVLYWLLRQEPFTALHLELQGGRFDHADRLFASLPGAWKGVWENPNDCKEMVPELYYDAATLRNDNDFVFGTTQAGRAVADVELPPWASSAEDFVRQHRAALESPWVSARLHLWIDLVFGHAQRGQAAADALNVFVWLTYPGAVDVDRVADPDAKAALMSQIEHFGQTPAQVFRKPHPPRAAVSSPARPSAVLASSPPMGYSLRLAPSGDGSAAAVEATAPLAVVTPKEAGGSGTFVLLFAGGRYATCRLTRVPEGQVPFRLEGGKVSVHPDAPAWGQPASRAQLAVASARHGAVFSCSHWDRKWRCHQVGEARELLAVGADDHVDTITCAAFGGRWLVTGSSDTTLLVWDVPLAPVRSTGPPLIASLHRGCGHASPITCVAVCAELHVCASGSVDGTVVVRLLRNARSVCSLPVGEPLLHVAIARCGVVVTCTRRTMATWSLTGRPLASRALVATSDQGHQALLVDPVDGRFVVSFEPQRLYVWCLDPLIPLCEYESRDTISAACVSPDGAYVICTHAQGKLSLFSFPDRNVF